jgi:hypothetical protein
MCSSSVPCMLHAHLSHPWLSHHSIYFVKRTNHEAPHANFLKPPVASSLPGSTILTAVNLSCILVTRHGHMLSCQCSFPAQARMCACFKHTFLIKAVFRTSLTLRWGITENTDNVAYRLVAKQWLYKQRPLLGNTRNIHARNNRTVFTIWSAPRPLLWNSAVNTSLQQ